MRHNDIHPDGDHGHWGVARSSDDIHMLVQIGEIEERHQVRLKLTVARALHLAADLLAAAETSGNPGTTMTGTHEGEWTIMRTGKHAVVTLRDEPPCAADDEATLEMPCDAMRAMAVEMLAVATGLLARRTVSTPA